MDISSQEHFDMGTFQFHGHSGTWTFCLHELFGTGIFRHGDIMALGHFGTKIFQHMDVSALGNFDTMQSNMGTDNLAPVLKCGTVPKHPFCQNIHVLKCFSAKMSLCQKIPVPKYPGAEISLCQKIPCAEKFMCQIISLPKCPWR